METTFCSFSRSTAPFIQSPANCRNSGSRRSVSKSSRRARFICITVGKCEYLIRASDGKVALGVMTVILSGGDAVKKT